MNGAACGEGLSPSFHAWVKFSCAAASPLLSYTISPICGYCLPHRNTTAPISNLNPQEKPEDVPTGELPRTVMVVADRQCCNIVTPGTRVTITGIYSTYKARQCDNG